MGDNDLSGLVKRQGGAIVAGLTRIVTNQNVSSIPFGFAGDVRAPAVLAANVDGHVVVATAAPFWVGTRAPHPMHVPCG